MGFNRLSGNEVAAAIDNRIQRVAQEVFTNSPANRTAFGKVVSVSNGYYTVEIASHRYTDIPSMRNIGDIAVNTTVVCLIPNNEYANMIILGVADGKTTLGTPIDLLNLIYPIGSIYLAVEDTSPAMLLGGTWTKIEEGKALWTSTSTAGNTISAGLPNVTGSFEVFDDNDDIPMRIVNPMGAFTGSAVNRAFLSGYGTTTRTEIQTAQLDLSLGEVHNGNYSNLVYGKSDTVQPPAYTVFAWRRIA